MDGPAVNETKSPILLLLLLPNGRRAPCHALNGPKTAPLADTTTPRRQGGEMVDSNLSSAQL